jgi:hypothetical protein
LELVAWRKMYNWGDDIAREAEPAEGPRNIDLLDAVKTADSVEGLRDVWEAARGYGLLTSDFRVAVDEQLAELKKHNTIGARADV